MDRNIPADIKRSQNAELIRGAVDGLLGTVRPNTSLNTDVGCALERAAHFDPKIHGAMGVGAPAALEVVFDKPIRSLARKVSKKY